MTGSSIRIAIDRYDRHMPLFTGQVSAPPGLDIEFLEVGMDPPRRHGVERHRRMLTAREFDAAEVSLASYLVARDRGMRDIVALPIYPRRLFSQNHIFTGSCSGITEPGQLAGRRVVIWAFQVTMSVLAKGDLQRDYGVDWRSIHWLTQNPEEIDSDYGDDVRIQRLPAGFDVRAALASGQVDAYINPHPSESIMATGQGIERLFPDWSGTTRRYFERYGYFPIMHVLAVKTEVLERHPELATELRRMFDEAHEIARSWYVDPGYSLIMHARNTLEYEIAAYHRDAWHPGDHVNRRNLEDFVDYCVDQRVIATPPSLDEVILTPG